MTNPFEERWLALRTAVRVLGFPARLLRAQVLTVPALRAMLDTVSTGGAP
jgi:hypothetical protein